MLTWTATVEDFAPYPRAREPTSKPRRAKLSGTKEAGLSSFSRRMAIDRITRARKLSSMVARIEGSTISSFRSANFAWKESDEIIWETHEALYPNRAASSFWEIV